MGKARFRDRILIYFSTVIVLPVLTLGVVGPLLYSRTVANLSAAYTRDAVLRVTTDLEHTIRDHEKLLEMILRDNAVLRFFESAPDVSSVQRMTDLFSATSASHPEIAGLIAVSADDRAFSTGLSRILRDPLTDEAWFRRAQSTSEGFFLFTRPIGRNLENAAGVGPDEIVSMVKSVFDPDDGRFLGVLMSDLMLEYLGASLAGSPEGDTVFYCILDDSGEFVYAPVNEIVYRINPDWFTDSGRIVEKTIGGRGYRFIFAESPYMGWKTVGVYYLEEALQPIRFVQTSALIITLVTIALAVAISMVYSSAITKPVLHLRSVMERAGHGDLGVRYDGRSRDEIDELGQGLNLMLDKIQDLLDLVYREQQSKRDAELRILQQQIKPHFLYNTLDTILWMADEKLYDQISEVVTALTNLFRVALSQGREVIRLREEIEHVRSYLTIQKIRYEEKFDFAIDCPPEILDLRVQKLILQPLVENAIYHGIKEKRGAGSITVVIETHGDALEIQITDDGVGIADETLRKIERGLTHVDHETDRAAFALYNVNDRIRLTYGDRFGITVASAVGAGTTVTIRHPILEEVGG